MTGSLAYRQNTAAILAGNPPEKYTRILPHIPAGPILEFGSAEGVLACLLAKRGDHVCAVEANGQRHHAATRLADKWGVSNITFLQGRAREFIDAVEPGQYNTLVAIRMIYYLRSEIDDVFAAIAERIPNVVLCGNRGRAKRYHAGTPDAPLGEFNYYASAEGMKDILTRHGYEIASEVLDGDAIVVGKRR